MIEFNHTIIIQFLNFLVLLFLLNFLLFKPILNALKKRQTVIKSLADKAEGNKQEAESLGKTYDESIKEKRKPIMKGAKSRSAVSKYLLKFSA